jgi:hypothetical protein
MRSILHFDKLLILLGSLLIATSCTQETRPESTDSTVKEDYQSYSKDGLSLRYPSHWSLAYDDNDALLANRDVSFETQQFSKISILIYDKSTVDESDVADILIRSIKPDTNKNIQDFQQTPIQISGFKGYRFTWKNTLLGISTFELTTLKSGVSTKPVFAVYILLDEDIEKESAYIIPFLKSISLQ